MEFLLEITEKVISLFSKIIKGDVLEWNIVYLLKKLSFLIVVVIAILAHYSFEFAIGMEMPILSFKRIGEDALTILDSLVMTFILYTFARWFIHRPRIAEFIKGFDVENGVLVKQTLMDLYRLCFEVCLSVKVICDLLLFILDEWDLNLKSIIVYSFLIARGIIDLIGRIYQRNKILERYWNLNYTDYYDSEGELIPESNEIVYRNRIYNMHWEDGEWWLSTKKNPNFLCKEIKLSDAVMDVEGKIRVYKSKSPTRRRT